MSKAEQKLLKQLNECHTDVEILAAVNQYADEVSRERAVDFATDVRSDFDEEICYEEELELNYEAYDYWFKEQEEQP